LSSRDFSKAILPEGALGESLSFPLLHGFWLIMPYQDSSHISAITMEDHLGIVYLIETAQQFWSGEPGTIPDLISHLLVQQSLRIY